MSEFAQLGAGWLADAVDELTERMEHLTPSEYNELNRILPASVTSIPGKMRFDVNPYMREILDCFDVNSSVKEVAVMKGVQMTITTLMESVVMYFADYIGTMPMMYVTADRGLAAARIENNFLPMFQQSELGQIIKSSDSDSSRKTGKTAKHLQFEKGGVLYPYGAQNANTMRMYSILLMLMDELDAWPLTVGRDGDPDALVKARTNGYGEFAKLLRASTPLLLGSSKIHKHHLRGDQREYLVLCKQCSFPQKLKWETRNRDTGIEGGIKWEIENGILIPESVHYACQNCAHQHFEHDKRYLYSPENGAHWKPTATPVAKNVRSYHLPALYSPVGMQSWSDCVFEYLAAFDPVEKKVRDIGAYQVFYNNILGVPFEVRGSKVTFTQISAHRRSEYQLGQIPNHYAAEYAGSPILFLTCQVDVHKDNLAVSVTGWCRDSICFLIDYWRFEDEDCREVSSPVWGRLRELIEEKEYVSDDGKKYRIIQTFIDSGYSAPTVTAFCKNYDSNVYPILGRDRPGKNQTLNEFAPFTAKDGTDGYIINVDLYKDRLAPVLRREWVSESGLQKPHHFNAPIDLGDKPLKEMIAEVRRKKVDDRGNVSYHWHRPGNKDNELGDLMNYGHCSVEVLAWRLCIEYFELETIDWTHFWSHIEEEQLYFTEESDNESTISNKTH